jgi:uncharacterized protein (TIGR03000 family)
MYSLILLCAAATSGEATACHHAIRRHTPRVYHPPVVFSSVMETEEESGEPEPTVHPQSEADQRMLREMMEWVPDAGERKKVWEYWLAPGIDSRARKEFYREIRKMARGGGEEEEAEDAPCTILVHLPADARLEIEGDATLSTGSMRKFISPELPAGRTFVYTLTATFERDGETVSVTGTVTVWAGSEAEVTIE